jgi:tetratricopeptide (TPR) repeat protein
MIGGCASNKDGDKPSSTSQSRGTHEGMTEFDKAKDPAFKPETFFAAGQFAETQGQTGRAIEQYTLAIKAKSDYTPALYRLGVVCTQAKMYPQAIEAWKGYQKATGDTAGGYSNLAFAYQLSGDDAQAEKTYQAGIAKDPKNRACRTNYGLLLARQGKLEAAVKQWEVVLSPAEVHYNLGSVCEQQKDKAGARAEYKTALELDPKMGDAKARLAALEKD